MPKKVLILSGSPRKGGNTDLLCAEFERGAKEAGHVVQTIRLGDQKIAPCLACDACQRQPGVCIQKDDAAGLLRAMGEAQVIVLATPVYFYSVSAQMKTLIDRSYATYQTLRGKSFHLMACAYDPNPAKLDLALDTLKAFVDLLPDSTVKSSIRAGGVYQKGDVSNTDFAKQAYQFGRGA